MSFKVALVGNPNSGKTTLFNRLTGSTQHVGNWPGVTIEKKSGSFNYEEHVITLIDLPGIYSMSTYSMEEVVSRNFIMDEHPDLIINIVDGTNLERNLYLSLQLKELGLPMVIAINMFDELTKSKIIIDCDLLSKLIKLPVVGISAKNGLGIQDMIHNLIHNTNSTKLDYDIDIENCVNDIIKVMDNKEYDATHQKFYAVKIFEEDDLIVELFDFSESELQKIDLIKKAYINQSKYNAVDMAIADIRYSFIEDVISKSVDNNVNRLQVKSEKIDHFLTHRYLGIPLFFVVLGLMFFITFGPLGSMLAGLVESIIEVIANNSSQFLQGIGASTLTQDLITTIINGVGSVLVLTPQIMLLFLMLSVIEDCGYMSRGAFLMDQALRKIGLNGKAFIPLLMGFGCSVPAIMASRILENEEDRKMTILLTPFMSCGARLPVYAIFASVFFPKSSWLVIFGLYVLGIIVAIMCGFLLKATIFKRSGSTFIMELPPYRLPSLKNTMMNMWDKAKDFLYKAGTIIFAMSVLFWVLSTFDFGFNVVNESSLSMLGIIGQKIAFIFTPLGFGNWEAVVSLFSGFIAKESVVATLSVVYKASSQTELATIIANQFTLASSLAFMVFTLLYVPCAATVATIKKETKSLTFTLKAILFQTLVAYVVAFIVYNVVIIIGG